MKQMLVLWILPLIVTIHTLFPLFLSPLPSWSTPFPSLRKVLWSISCSDSWTCDQSARNKNRNEQTESRWQGSKYQPSPPPLKRALPLPLLRLLPAPSPSISLQPKVGRRRGIWKGIGADRLWKPWQLEQTLGGSILLIYAVFHSPNCSHFTLISKIAVQILNALWSFCCLYWASAVFKGELLTANLLPRSWVRTCGVPSQCTELPPPSHTAHFLRNNMYQGHVHRGQKYTENGNHTHTHTHTHTNVYIYIIYIENLLGLEQHEDE